MSSTGEMKVDRSKTRRHKTRHAAEEEEEEQRNLKPLVIDRPVLKRTLLFSHLVPEIIIIVIRGRFDSTALFVNLCFVTRDLVVRLVHHISSKQQSLE